MKLYNEEDQAEQGKLQNVKFEAKKRGPGRRMELNAVFKEINRVKESLTFNGKKESGDLRARYPPHVWVSFPLVKRN